MKVKLCPVPTVSASRYADSAPARAVTAIVTRPAARGARESRGMTIAASSARKTLRNGTL